MISLFVKLAFVTVLLTGAGSVAYSQPDLPDPFPPRPGRRGVDAPPSLKAMLAKQRLERDKKDHEEMLRRGEQALRLANQLEASFSQNKNLSSEDKARLESLETAVEKIRTELGGDDDDGVDPNHSESDEEPKPSTMEEAFKYLQKTTVKLVDELKKTTRFTISAMAIQSSNNVLRLVKFLRLRK